MGTIFIAQAVIPLIKSSYTRRRLLSTYRSYLLAHVSHTLEHFRGIGSTHFSESQRIGDSGADWLTYLRKHDLDIPEIFIRVESVIHKTLTDDKYIPSVSYLGLDGNLLDHTSPIWSLNGPETAAALEYFLTQQQIETAIAHQYSGWYFELIKSNREDRERWCRGLENILFDMAQHYGAARRLRDELVEVI